MTTLAISIWRGSRTYAPRSEAAVQVDLRQASQDLMALKDPQRQIDQSYFNTVAILEKV